VAAIAEDFGDGTQAGTFAYNAGTDVYTLQGQGGLDGSGMFYGQSYSGDFVLTALQTDATSGATDARSGIMIRDTMDNGAMAFVGRIPTGSYASFVWRTNPKGGTSGLNGITQKRRWLRFIRRGNQITALHAADNAGTPGTWAQLGQPQNVFMGPTVMAGLYCDNAGGVGLNTATFTKLTVVPLNKAPIVDAGSVASPATSPVALVGSASDDGLPSPLTTLWTVASAPGAVVFGNTGSLSTNATFSVGGIYTLRLWGDDGIARTFDDVSFSSSAFAAWQAANFPGGSANPDAAALADPDNDGVNNALEYTCNTNPNSSTSQPGTLSIVTVGADQYLRLTVTKNPAATDASIVVEAGSDLQPGSWSSVGLVVEQNTAAVLQVRDSVPLGAAPSRFLRAKVTVN
jgi:hypothetical protein